MNKGYPPGTRCVITWVPESMRDHPECPSVGDVVEVDDWIHSFGDYYDGPLGSGITLDSIIQGFGRNWYFADYMRPLEDPDTEDHREEHHATSH